ncbi:hypothetical protein, unlikely [Trypanosoma brucei gambiense DAL972]|uniref:Uncharacterized protein n=1 Tax=Trypanosoma brucei gambiense (strain MHOM/CI/86/DAL972) TaxID=679716 RepID=D0A5U5_TRYB9|nr:hypothetical protein, unlikely [Trypanosoma brucei gambiense DAL972]CBH17046.1 hypothetical protein, unlikely [Trypanosoma brucei gambiense DAL972]|eukprot:XP_011779310.1 hypothetical protein, unlikely [Trypanosoma brucei gambiense DAL972]
MKYNFHLGFPSLPALRFVHKNNGVRKKMHRQAHTHTHAGWSAPFSGEIDMKCKRERIYANVCRWGGGVTRTLHFICEGCFGPYFRLNGVPHRVRQLRLPPVTFVY